MHNTHVVAGPPEWEKVTFRGRIRVVRLAEAPELGLASLPENYEHA
jgi:hypothetical protein